MVSSFFWYILFFMHQNEKHVTSQKTVMNFFQINFPAIPDQILLRLPVLSGQFNLGSSWKGIIFQLSVWLRH